MSSWRGMDVGFTDGICQKCAARVRSDMNFSRTEAQGAAGRQGVMPGIAVVAVAVMAAVVLIARPTHELPMPVEVALRTPDAADEATPPEPASSALPARVFREPPVLLTPARPAATVRPLPVSMVGRRVSSTTVYRMRPPRDSVQSP